MKLFHKKNFGKKVGGDEKSRISAGKWIYFFVGSSGSRMHMEESFHVYLCMPFIINRY